MAYASVAVLRNQSISIGSLDPLFTVRLGPVRTLAGTVIDFSGWNTFQLMAKGPPGIDGDQVTVITVVTGDIAGNSDGTLDVTLRSGDLAASSPPGRYNWFLEGKPTSGDSYQAIMTGTMQMSA